jgi:hypothetical protein
MTELPDRLLRDALRSRAPADAANVCVDAEALAAWADGTMIGAARTAFEIHAADCARCQALIAAMARSAPPPIEAARWRRAFFAWLMPLAAATAALVVVIFLSINQRRVPETQTALSQPAAAPSRAEEMAPSRAAAPPAPAPPAPAPAGARAPGRAIADARRDGAAAKTPSARPRDQRKGDTSPPSAAPTTAAPQFVAPAPAAAAEATAAAAALQPKRLNTRDEAQLRMMKAATAPLLIASPARDWQWRIVGGAVEHTDDGGATWRAQALGVDDPVRAGTSPAARVCWLAGARGLVLLTTDGAHWRRIGLPETVDLVAIEATDGSHATVTTVTGRRFTTSDGGMTWTGR